MAQFSRIEWTQCTWNPVTGCTKISPGCAHCYAERMARRLHAMGNRRYADGFRLTLHEDLLEEPLKWRGPRVVFVNSMSDLFHEDVPVEFVRQVFETMVLAKQHTFQVLTKRAERMASLAPSLPWPTNVWAGVTVEGTAQAWRIDHLRAVPAAVRFVSAEPLLGPLPGLGLRGIDWLIAGGESGPGARAMHPAWVRDLRDRCAASGTAFFFKQWGGVRKKQAGRILDGREWSDMPVNHRLHVQAV